MTASTRPSSTLTGPRPLLSPGPASITSPAALEVRGQTKASPATLEVRGQTKASPSAEIVCAMRALDQALPADRRLLGDAYAQVFVSRRSYRARYATPTLARLTAAVFDRLYPSYLGIVLLRQRYWDDVLAQAAAQGIHQVIVLGAGYDTTALRHDLPGATVYEVDAPPTQRAKRHAMAAAGVAPSQPLVWVACDFECDNLAERLLAAGFDPQRPSVTVWYGVTFFITEAAVRATLAGLAELSAPGSRLVWDHLHESVAAGTSPYRGARRAHRAMIKRQEPYRFGVDRQAAQALVRHYGYEVDEHVSLLDLAQRYRSERGAPYRIDDVVGVMSARRPEARP